MKLIDIHCHTMPRDYLDYLEKLAAGQADPSFTRQDGIARKSYGGGRFQLAMTEAIFDPAVILSRMDEAGVTLSMISGSPDPGFLAPDLQPEACRRLNDCVAAIVADHPGRFLGIGVLPWPCPDESVREAQRLKQLGFKSVMLFSHCGQMQVDDSSLDAAYAACERLGLPISMHPDVPLWYDAANCYGLVTNVTFVMDTSLALLRMIQSGVFDRFPGLRLIMPHAGGVLPSLDGRLSYTPPDFRRFVPQDRKRPPEYLKSENIWYDVSNASVHVLKMIKEYVGTERLMYGSDYPSVEQAYLLELLRQSGFSADELEAISWRNAERLFGPLG